MRRILFALLIIWALSVIGIVLLFGCEAKEEASDGTVEGIDGEYFYTYPVQTDKPVEYEPIDTSVSGKPADLDLSHVFDKANVRHIIIGDSVSACGMVSYTKKDDISAVMDGLQTEAEFYLKGASAYSADNLKQYIRISIYLEDSVDGDIILYVLPDGTLVCLYENLYYITSSGAVDYNSIYGMSPAGKEESWETLISPVTPSDMINGRSVVSAHFGGSMYSSHLSLDTEDRELIDEALDELFEEDVSFVFRTEEPSVITFLTFDSCTARLTFDGGDSLCFYIIPDGTVIVFYDGYYYRTADGVADFVVFRDLHYRT